MDSSTSTTGVLAVSVATAARQLGISKANLYRIAKDDPSFPKFKFLGKRSTRIKLTELTAWLDRQGGGINGKPR